MYIVAHYMAVSDFTHGHRGLSVQGVFESPQHEITTKYEFQISQSTKGKFDQSNGLAFSTFVEILRAQKRPLLEKIYM